jgi:hypothetical protein
MSIGQVGSTNVSPCPTPSPLAENLKPIWDSPIEALLDILPPVRLESSWALRILLRAPTSLGEGVGGALDVLLGAGGREKERERSRGFATVHDPAVQLELWFLSFLEQLVRDRVWVWVLVGGWLCGCGWGLVMITRPTTNVLMRGIRLLSRWCPFSTVVSISSSRGLSPSVLSQDLCIPSINCSSKSSG